MPDAVQWHSRRVAACVLVLLCVITKEETESGGMLSIWTRQYISRDLTRVAYNKLVQELLLLQIFFESTYSADEISHRSRQF